MEVQTSCVSGVHWSCIPDTKGVTMPMSDLINKALKAIKANTPEIYTALGVSGVVSTAYLAGKAAVKADRVVTSDERISVTYDRKERFKQEFKLVWKYYIPPVISGAVTIACIVATKKTGSRRTTAAVTAYSLTERAFSEYRDKVVEQIGEGKEQKIATLGPGDVFGEMALLDEFPRSATARAVEPTTALGIQRWHFRGILESHPQIALALLPMLTRRIRNAEGRSPEAARH